MLSVLGALSICTCGATNITTLPEWDGVTRFVAPQLGSGNSQALATLGQTFTVPDGSPVLLRFGIKMVSITPDPLLFGGYLTRWDGQRSIGPVLYESSQMSLSPGWSTVVFNLDLSVTPGDQYVFILSSLNFMDGLDRRGELGGFPSDIYSGGGLVALRADSTAFTDDNWAVFSPSPDTAFFATFSDGSPPAVPDPANASLLAFSAAFLAFAKVWKKRH